MCIRDSTHGVGTLATVAPSQKSTQKGTSTSWNRPLEGHTHGLTGNTGNQSAAKTGTPDALQSGTDMGNHQHSVGKSDSAGGHQHDSVAAHQHSIPQSDSAGSHQHDSVAAHQHTLIAGAQSSLPPYYALCFIMKT